MRLSKIKVIQTLEFEKRCERIYLEFHQDERLKHVTKVKDIALQLNSKLQLALDEDIITEACLLHDISSVYNVEDYIPLCKSYKIKILKEEESHPILLHQHISNIIAKHCFGIGNDYVLDAIDCHTTLRPQATQLDLLLFAADKLSRKDVWSYDETCSLEELCCQCLETIIHKKTAILHPTLILSYEDLLLKRNKGEIAL